MIASEHSIDLTELRSLVMEAWMTKALYPYVPFWFMYFVSWCLEILALFIGKTPLVTRRNIASTIWDREYSIEKAKRELGYIPQVEFRKGISETVEWFKTKK